MTKPSKSPRRFLRRRAQAQRYGVSLKTIQRWGRDPEMNMPDEFDFNGHPCRIEDQLEVWEKGRVAPRNQSRITGYRKRGNPHIEA
jgi:hypothetical protein